MGVIKFAIWFFGTSKFSIFSPALMMMKSCGFVGNSKLSIFFLLWWWWWNCEDLSGI